MSNLAEFEYSPVWDIYPAELCQLFIDQLEILLVLAQENPQIFFGLSLYLFPEDFERSKLVVHGEKISVNVSERKSLDEIKQIWQENKEKKKKTPVIVHLVLNSPYLFQQPIVHDFTSSEPVIVDSAVVTKQKTPEINPALEEINKIISTLVAIAICSLRLDEDYSDTNCQTLQTCPFKKH